MTALVLTGTNHAEDQPAHLRVRTEEDGVVESPERRGEHVRVNVEEYGGLLGRACPAGVYEYVDDEGGSSGKAGGGGEETCDQRPGEQLPPLPSHRFGR